MDPTPPPSEEQVALFREHLSVQRDEIAARMEQSRTEESLERHRMTTDAQIHEANLSHAGKVLEAQANDRRETRQFWKDNLSCVFNVIYALLGVVAVVMCVALWQGKAAEVIALMEKLAGYFVALVAGAGLDRAWLHRRKTGISNPAQE